MNGFGDDWNDAVQQQQQDEQNAMMDQAYKDQKASWDDYSGLVGKANQHDAQRQLAMQNDVDCLMSLAASNGGAVPQVAIDMFNRKFGFDPIKGTGMFSAKYDDRGNFGVQVGAGMGPDGKPVLQDQVAGPMDQWIMMNRNKAAFTDDIRVMYRDFLSKSYSDAELDKAAGITRPVGAKTESGGTVVPGSWLTGPQKKGNISAFGADGKGHFSNTDYNEATGRYERRESGRVEAQEQPMSERERIEIMKEQGRNARAEARNQGRMDIAELQAELKNRGYDISEDKLREIIAHNQATEAQQVENEAGRNARADAKLDVDWAKHDQAVKKWRDQYEIAMKEAKTDEERAEIDRKYKEGRIAIQEGRLDLDWSRHDEQSAHNQATEEQGQQKIDETKRSNEVKEGQRKQEIELKREQLEFRQKMAGVGKAIDKRWSSGDRNARSHKELLKTVDTLISKGDKESMRKANELGRKLLDIYGGELETGGGPQPSANGASKDGEPSVEEMRRYLKNRNN